MEMSKKNKLAHRAYTNNTLTKLKFDDKIGEWNALLNRNGKNYMDSLWWVTGLSLVDNVKKIDID